MTSVNELTQWIRQHANPERAIPMAAYMRYQFPFLGIPAPERERLTKQFFAEHGEFEQYEVEPAVRQLWALPEREYAYIALAILRARSTQSKLADIQLIEDVVVSKPWWDTVDVIASNLAGNYFRKYPEQIPSITERWMCSSSIWLQRTAILFQLSYKQATDTELLFRLICRCADSREFFIQKAIGWALREYAKTNRSAVEQFVSIAKLQALSKREALKVKLSPSE